MDRFLAISFFKIVVRIWLVPVAALFIACTSPTQKLDLVQLQQQLSAVKDGQALVRIIINQKDFYQNLTPFEAVTKVLPNSLKMSIINPQNRSNIELEGVAENWATRRPKHFMLTNHTVGETGGDALMVMIGKLIQQPIVKGEGYILAKGTLTLRELTPERIILVIEGSVVRPGEATAPENYQPLTGCILIKKPKLVPESDLSIFSSAL